MSRAQTLPTPIHHHPLLQPPGQTLTAGVVLVTATIGIMAAMRLPLSGSEGTVHNDCPSC
jgi:hypothetical protein